MKIQIILEPDDLQKIKAVKVRLTEVFVEFDSCDTGYIKSQLNKAIQELQKIIEDGTVS